LDGKNKRRIKLTYLVDFFRTLNAGTERQLGYLLNHLPEAGYAVELISLQDSPFLKREVPGLFPGVQIYSLGATSDISKSLPALVDLYLILRRSRPDIVHTFFPASNSFGVLIARLARIRRIISSRRDMGYHLTRKDIRLLKASNLLVNVVVANSHAVQERTIQLEGIRREKTRVIHNGISLDDFKPTSGKKDDKHPVVGIVANLNRPVKRVDLFIKAAALVHEALPDITFWIVGDGYLRPDLEQLSSGLGLNSNLLFLGRRDDVRELLKQISIGVICSDSEGLSNAIMEYMAAGLPVVATDVGGNPELVEDGKTGLLIRPGEAQDLTDALITCLAEGALARQMGLSGRQRLCAGFSVERMLGQTVQLYEEVFCR
jgi:L-malate glycosyltransferase